MKIIITSLCVIKYIQPLKCYSVMFNYSCVTIISILKRVFLSIQTDVCLTIYCLWQCLEFEFIVCQIYLYDRSLLSKYCKTKLLGATFNTIKYNKIWSEKLVTEMINIYKIMVEYCLYIFSITEGHFNLKKIKLS